MSAKKILVVFGVTGTQGGSLINTILNDPTITEQFEIRGITRDPSSASAAALAEKGIAILKADLDDKDSLREALKDAHTVFAVTNWQALLNKEREIQQGKAVADIAKELNVQHLIWSSLPNVTKISGGTITGVLHFDSKAIVEDYIRSIGVPATFVQFAVYMHFIPLQLVPTSPGAKSYKLFTPMPLTTKVPLISATKDAGKYVQAIIHNREKFLGEQIFAGEREYSIQETADILTKVGGLDVVAEQCPDEFFRGILGAGGFPEFLQDDMSQNMKFIKEYGFYGGGKVVDFHSILTEPLETFEQWVAGSKEVAALR